MAQIDKVRALLRLGAEDTEEGRTAAHQAARLISSEGFAVIEKMPAEEQQAQRAAPAPAPVQPSASPFRTPDQDADDWTQTIRAGIADFARKGLRHVGGALPEIVYTRRKTRCGGCGRVVTPPNRMIKFRTRGLRCVPCSQKLILLQSQRARIALRNEPSK